MVLPDDQQDRPLIERAQELLGVIFTEVESLVPAGRRHQVMRCRHRAGTVVVKNAGPIELDAYRRLESTGLTARVMAGEPGVLILEDVLGPRLDELLAGGDPLRASRLLVAMAGALGAMHRETLAPGHDAAIVDPAFSTFRALCETLAVTADFDDFTVGPLVSLTQRDVGPDNCIATADGVMLVDFELAARDHPLMDTAHWWFGFPCCGCTGSLPRSLVDEMDAAHAAALGHGIEPAAASRARARLLCNRIVRLVEWGALDEDWLWGRATARQRMLALLAGFRCPQDLPEFTDTVCRLERTLRIRWPSVADVLAPFPGLR